MHRFFLLLLLSCLPYCLSAQKTYKLKRWGIPAGNYSGITPLGNNQYAIVSDKESKAGFYVWKIDIDSITGKLLNVEDEGYRGAEWPQARDAEGIAFCAQRGTIFISGEADQRILEHRMDGSLTGNELQVPEELGTTEIQSNRGFESLTYDADNLLFWTCTESALKNDDARLIRMQTFGLDLKPQQQYTYTLDPEQASDHGRDYYHGVVDLIPLAKDSLLVLEREVRIAPNYTGSKCWCKIYGYNPKKGIKSLVQEWHTRFTITNTRMANYEGMCLGPRLADGRQTVLLICDSQAGYGIGPWRLRDRLKIVTINP